MSEFGGAGAFGYFAVHRSVWDNDIFEPAPFGEREAWLWLISSAAWKPCKVRVGNQMVPLNRGQLMFATRFLAKKFKWSHTTTVRFLNLLESETMIGTQATRHGTLITICNYDKYQLSGNGDGTQDGTQDGTEVVRKWYKEEEPKKVIIDDGGNARAKLISDEAQETADAMAAACGFPDPKSCPFGWYGAAIWVQKCLNEGWAPSLMIEGSRATAAKKRDGPIESYRYLEKPLARFIAEHSRPLPEIEIRQAEKVIAYGTSRPNKGNSLIAAIDRQLAAIEEADRINPEMPESVVLSLPSRSIR